MKTLNVIIIFCLFLGFTNFPSCKKERDEEVDVFPFYEPGDQSTGWAKAIRSGKEWAASGSWSIQSDSLWYMTFTTYSTYGELRESISINEIPQKLGRFILSGNFGTLGDGVTSGRIGFLADDGDVYLGGMGLNLAKESFVQVTELDLTARTVKGTFSLYFSNEDGLEYELINGEFALGGP